MYKLIRNSTVRMIVETFQPWMPKVQYYEWDGHAQTKELPRQDLVGLVNFSCKDVGQFHDIDFSIAIMTVDDPSLGRLTDYVDAYYRRLQGQARYDVYKPDGTLAGYDVLIFEGTDASPMGRVDTRPTAEISVSGRVGRAGLQ